MPGALERPMTQSPRYDLYGPIHKGLRLALSQLLVRLGSTDFADPTACRLIGEALEQQIALSALHLEDEDRFIHPALAARAPETVQGLDVEHREHRAQLAALAETTAVLLASSDAERPAVGRRLYLEFSRFVADDFVHMHEEETVVLPTLHALFTDAELAGMEQAIIGALPPTDLLDFMRLMLPAMTPAERRELLAGVRQDAPAEVFALLIEGAAKPALSAADWRRLASELAVAA